LSFFNKRKEGRKKGNYLPPFLLPPSPPHSQVSQNYFFRTQTTSKQVTAKTKKDTKQSWATLLLLSSSYCSCNTKWELLQKQHRSGNTKTNQIVEIQ
jgi:hypothetical protein